MSNGSRVDSLRELDIELLAEDRGEKRTPNGEGPRDDSSSGSDLLERRGMGMKHLIGFAYVLLVVSTAARLVAQDPAQFKRTIKLRLKRGFVPRNHRRRRSSRRLNPR